MSKSAVCLMLGLCFLSMTTAAEADESGFDVVVAQLGAGWTAIRYNTTTGQCWYRVNDGWKETSEAGEQSQPTKGDYQVKVVVYGPRNWMAMRFEKQTGQTWILNNDKQWSVMRVLHGEQSAAPVESMPSTPKPTMPSLAGTWREIRNDNRMISIVIDQNLAFRQSEVGENDFTGKIVLRGNQLSLLDTDGGKETFTVNVTATTITFFDNNGNQLDFSWQRQ